MHPSSADDRFAAFRHSSYTRFFFARFLGAFATQILSVSVGWQMYDQTGNVFYLGLIGLVQFLPSLMLILVTGSVADRYNRRAIVSICMILSALCAAALLFLTVTDSFEPTIVFAILVVFGIERAFAAPAVQSLAPNLVPQKDLSNAVAWNSSSWQTASIVGPVAGGLLYGASPVLAYSVSLAFFAGAAVLVFLVKRPPQRQPGKAVTLDTLFAGFRFIFGEKVVLGAISLDLFAVLLGGAVALMPVFARDILDLGPWGLGLLRAAPGIGAIIVAIALATLSDPPQCRDLHVHRCCAVRGWHDRLRLVRICVAVDLRADADGRRRHGVRLCSRDSDCTVDAGRGRGRVNAVNMVFVGASNELGEFRAGTLAHFIGPVPAVVLGGFGTLAVAAVWALGFPQLRKIDSLEAPERQDVR
jgi:MFS family permease